jgi:WD40 repeat protein
VITGHSGSVFAVAVGPVGKRAVIVSGGADATVRVWDAQPRSLLHVLDTLTAAHCLAYFAGTCALYIVTGTALGPGFLDDRLGAAYGAGPSVEGGQEAVSEGFHPPRRASSISRPH